VSFPAGAGLRIGQGFDLHPFLAPGDDAGDRVLGAAGLGDIGQHFPDTDPAWAGADSIALLVEVTARVRAAGWVPANVDCTVIAERPKLSGRRDEMQQRLSDAVGAPVSVKATRAEGLGALGRTEGIACLAVALLMETS
jgi:2-C-methyl-D-erythritol 2,4-cyclodiphosphate synthase